MRKVILFIPFGNPVLKIFFFLLVLTLNVHKEGYFRNAS